MNNYVAFNISANQEESKKSVANSVVTSYATSLVQKRKKKIDSIENLNAAMMKKILKYDIIEKA